jgi:hypothetical protein
VRAEVDRLPRDLDPVEVEVAKEGLLRGLRMDSDLPVARCAMDVIELLDRGRRFDLATVRDELAAVTVDEVRELAAQILRPEHKAAALCGPEGVDLP